MIGNRLTDAQQVKLQNQFSQLGATLALLSIFMVGIYIQDQEMDVNGHPFIIEGEAFQRNHAPVLIDKRKEAMPMDTASFYTGDEK